MKLNRTLFLVISTALLGAASLQAADAIEFDFKDPKGVNAMTFSADSALEPIFGVASGVTGKLSFDPADPRKLTGTIIVAADSVKCTNAKMTEVLHGKDWFNVEEHKTIEFKITGVNSVRAGGENKYELETTGDFTLKGKTKSITIGLRIEYLPGKLGERMGGREGDLFVVRSDFDVMRKDFGVDSAKGSALVADKVEIRTALVGVAPKK